jgi:Flp pilus assembly protein TadG
MSIHTERRPAASAGSGVGDRTGTADATRNFAGSLRRLLRCDRGVAAVEFGLAAPILLAVLIPVADLGMAFSKEQQLRQAVQAGAQYAAAQSSWDPGAISNVVAGATALSGISVSPAPRWICGCPGVGTAGPNSSAIISSGIVWVACGSTCPQGQTAGRYAIVSAQVPYKPILPYSLLGSSTTLTAQAIARIG